MGVMAGLLVRAFLVVLGSLEVVLRGVLMMLGGGVVMLDDLVRGHVLAPSVSVDIRSSCRRIRTVERHCFPSGEGTMTVE